MATDVEIEASVFERIMLKPGLRFGDVRTSAGLLADVPEGELRQAIWRLIDRRQVELSKDMRLYVKRGSDG